MLTQAQLLKVRLMTEGLVVPQETRLNLQSPLTLADYPSTSGITMVIDNDVWVNAPFVDFNPNFVKNPPHKLVLRGGSFFVESENREYRVRVLPVPSYHDKRTTDGQPYIWYAVTHSDRVRISPVGGCAMACWFCDIPYSAQYHKKSVENLVESVKVALEDQILPARHVLISGGTPRPNDYDWENIVYERVVHAFPQIHVDIMMVPMPGLLNVRKLEASGIHGLSINIEMWNQETARRIMASKVKAGRKLYLDFIEEAVHVFGSKGRIRSLILVGIESLESTLEGVEALAQRGCDPVLSPFRPDPATPMRYHRPPSVDILIEAYERSLEIVERYGVKLGPRCIPCQHNTLTFNDGTGAYSYS